MNKRSMAGYERITKHKARAMYNAGQTIYIHPVNLNPCGYMSPAVVLKQDQEQDFCKMIAAYEYYNCAHHEVGKYAAFYARPSMPGR